MDKIHHQFLHFLADGEFHSPQSIGLALQLPFSEIRKAIEDFEEAGLDIETFTDHGYRIRGGLELLNRKIILDQLSSLNQSILDELCLFNIIDSTNTYLSIQKQPPQIMAVFAEQQTQGKGQQGRHWISPFGKNIYCSVLWHFKKDLNAMMGLSLAVAVAISRGLRAYGVNEGLGLKWPNDIYYHGQKLCGILLETAMTQQHACKVIIGFGVNVHIPTHQALSIQQPWTCLENMMNHKIQRNRLAGLLLNEVLSGLSQFDSHGLEFFLKEWHDLDYLYGKKIHLSTAQQTLTGIMQGISPRGELLLLDDQHQQQICLNGSVRLVATS